MYAVLHCDYFCFVCSVECVLKALRLKGAHFACNIIVHLQPLMMLLLVALSFNMIVRWLFLADQGLLGWYSGVV
jgi:hypothetical protein